MTKVLLPGLLATAAVAVFQVAPTDSASPGNAQELQELPQVALSGATPAPVDAARDDDGPGDHLVRFARRLSASSPASGGTSPDPDDIPDEALTGVVQGLCVTCHNDQLRTGNLSLVEFDVAEAPQRRQTAEKMITKLRLNMMPPPGVRRPGGDTLLALVQRLEEKVDAAASEDPNPGIKPLQRLNRAEYGRSVKDLLGVEIDPSAYLPPETMSDDFDNVADVQTVSSTLLEGFMRAASHVARVAVGDPDATPRQVTYKIPRTTAQLDPVEGAPYGSRGGISVVHNFPSDGEYVFHLELHPEVTGYLYGRTARDEELEVSINGERVATVEVNRWIYEAQRNGMRMETPPIFVPAGPQRVSAVFVPAFEGPINDLLSPIEHTMADTRIGLAHGITTVPHLRDLIIEGPHNVTGVAETPSREKIFTCRPTEPSEARPCAERIIRRLAADAYRRPLNEGDVEGLLALYEEGARAGGFEDGIRVALEAILASPHFVFRFEKAPRSVDAGEVYRLDDLALASRLSYFLWAMPPDEELLEVAREGDLSDRDVLREQARRMLEDPRSEALATRFASQWLRLQRLDVIHPDPRRHPEFDDRLREAMRRETELLFYSLVEEDRSVFDFFTADYTFVNERLARHYGIPGIVGNDFVRVPVTDERRRGLFGQASVLTLTSHANRTSPVDRGKWVMEVLLGTSPPPPPPGVPDLEVTESVDEESGRALTVRERMEIHRANPTCNACHQFIDPLGLPLENYDVTGLWRIRDEGNPIDSRGELWDGTPVKSPQDLRQLLLDMKIPVARNFTTKLMTYALGRRIHPSDQPTVRKITRKAAEEDYRLSALILGVVESDPFRMGRMETIADDDEEDDE